MKKTDVIALADLDIGESAQIAKVFNKNKRITQLGIIAGTAIEKIMCSPFGDPCAYLVHGSVIALREYDAQNIFVHKTEKIYD